MKNFIIAALFLSASIAQAKDFSLANAQAEYTVKHLVKTVKGESKELKGKMVCESQNCEFLIAIRPVSFVSSDSNRDLNMHTILEVSKYPVITVKGTMPEADLGKPNYELKSKVSFHGIEKEYLLKIKNGAVSKGQLTILLDAHNVERPSLLLAKIDNEVPVDFSFKWQE